MTDQQRLRDALAGIDWDQVLARFIQDELARALPSYWRRRADQLDQVGTEWGDAAALACRRHATLVETGAPAGMPAELAEYWAHEFGELAA